MQRSWRAGITALFVLGALALAACSSTTTPVASKTPTASDILAQAKAAKLKDATYTIAIAFAATGLAGNITGAGDGKLTTHPQRSSSTINFSISNTTFAYEIITDGKDTYTKQRSEAKWSKNAVTLPVNPSGSLNYDLMQHPTLVGAETINGIATWHLKSTGQTTVTSATATANPTPTTVSGTEDIWVRQDNAYPVKIIIDASQVGGTATITTQFSAWDTGVTIALPTPDQITSGS